MGRTCVHITGPHRIFNAIIVNGNDAFDGLLFGDFFPILMKVFQFCIFQVNVNLGPNFSLTFLLLNTCLDLDRTTRPSHLFDFLIHVCPQIIIV